MAAIMLLCMGQFVLFTYLRPFLETVTRVEVSALSLILLIVGVPGLIGTSLIGSILAPRLYNVLITIPLGMASIAVALIALGGWAWGTAALLAAWGLMPRRLRSDGGPGQRGHCQRMLTRGRPLVTATCPA